MTFALDLESKRADIKQITMNKFEEKSSYSELLQSQVHIWHKTHSYINSASLKCAVQLNIPDIIHSHGKPMTLAELARALPINQTKAHFLPQLMGILVESGFFLQQKVHMEVADDDDENLCFALTPASRLLLKDELFVARNFILTELDPKILKAWQSLGDWFLNDDPTPFYTAHGMGFWKYVEKDSILGSSFNKSMEEDSRLISKMVTEEFKGVFDGLTSLTDVGGCTGTMSRDIAETFPHLRCIVFDLPHIVANLKGSENIEFAGGDMFKEIPTANAVLLKSIMHDWGDEDCVKILKKCKAAIPSKENGGKVIIIDIVMENNNGDNNESVNIGHSLFNMKMVVLCGSKERTKKQWAKLFNDAGFSHFNISPLFGLRSIIEAYP